jgi:cell division protein FtsI/penicillin-binding protein 2
VLGIPAESVSERLQRKRRFVWLRRKLDGTVMEEVSRLGLPGVGFRKEFLRVYPHDELASNIIGFVGIDNIGLEGVEYQYNQLLASREGAAEQDTTAFGRNIVLTIDRYIQERTEDELKKAIEACGARQGAAVVMDIRSGRILALAKAPGFNPNRYYAYPEANLRSFSVTDAYEPGSTMKILSLVAAYEHDPSLFRRGYVCNGSIGIADVAISCERPHGRVGISEIVAHSCNVGVIETMKSVPREKLHETLKAFGFGMKTDSGIPGESGGIFRETAQWSGLSKYSISIGYELSVTSLQMAAAFSAIANDGVYNSPVIIERVENENGDVLRGFYPRSRGRVCQEKTARLMMQLMRGAVTGGTARAANIGYYTVVGKTGTSKKFSRQKGLYSDMSMSSFAGIAPLENPRICVYVVMDSPAGGESGGTVAAPVFARIAGAVMPYLGITKVSYRGVHPVKRKSDSGNFDGRAMPDFTGMSLAPALDLLARMQAMTGVRYSIQGTGRIYKQVPEAGSPLKPGHDVVIYFH